MSSNVSQRQPAKPAGTTRRFTYVAGTSDKFWSITASGSTVTVHFGRNGTAGQTNTRDCLSSDQAVKRAEKLVSEKLAKRYVEVS